MAATEKQLQALAKARATRKQKIAAGRARTPVRELNADDAGAEAVWAYPYGHANHPETVARVQDVESERDTLRAEALLQQALDSVGVRRADGSGLMHDRCSLCQEKGVHHTVPIGCDCWCHKAREALGGIARAA